MGSFKNKSILYSAAVSAALVGTSFWAYRGWFHKSRTAASPSEIVSPKAIASAAGKVQLAPISEHSALVPTIDLGSLNPIDIAVNDPQVSPAESSKPRVRKNKKKSSKPSVEVAHSGDSKAATPAPELNSGLYLPLAATNDADAANHADVVDAMRSRTVSIPKVRGTVQGGLPPLEIQRLRSEDQLSTAGNPSTNVGNGQPIKIDADFECGTAVQVEQKSPTHLLVTLVNQTDLRDWFMFRVAGAAGKTIRIDIRGGDTDERKWTSLNPVFSDCENLYDASTYSSDAASIKANVANAWNGAPLPSTEAQKWHFIDDCWMDDSKTFSFVQEIASPVEYVAMRVPRPPGYNEQWCKKLAANPLANIIDIGKSQGEYPLQIVKIASASNEEELHKPCVVVYAGEHADEQDSMWVAQGMIEFLVGDTAEAKELRKRLTLLIIPTFDPFGTAASVHSHTIVRFLSVNQTPESVAYANWFQDWVNQGHRLDVVLDLHNMQSSEMPHLVCFEMEGIGLRGKASADLNRTVLKNVQAAGFDTSAKIAVRGWSPDRLGGWLARRYGALSFIYEVNSEAAERHLTFEQTKGIGPIILQSIPGFLDSASGKDLMANIDLRRYDRASRWANFKGIIPSDDAIAAEAVVSKDLFKRNGGAGDLLIEKWEN